MAHLEIIKDYCVEVHVYGRDLLVSPMTDVISRFVVVEYDYLRYLDPEQQKMTFEFLGQGALRELAGFGVPETRRRLKMQQSEHDAYLEWQAETGMRDFEMDFTTPTPEEEIDRFFD